MVCGEETGQSHELAGNFEASDVFLGMIEHKIRGSGIDEEPQHSVLVPKLVARVRPPEFTTAHSADVIPLSGRLRRRESLSSIQARVGLENLIIDVTSRRCRGEVEDYGAD